ncbi:MAG: acetolactate synthase large subunit, partial [Chloroflexota bacterium]|nr:acetolactate synthase large subunit [Chloroflexota bacterium]
VLFAAREVLPDETIVLSDVGSHKMALGSLWSTRRPRTFLLSNGLGTMGFSLPGAIAAKLLRPDAPVACFMGDGGFAMVGSELGTAVDLRLPVIVVVFNDQRLDRIVRKQVQLGYRRLGTTFGNPNFVKLAEAYGAAGFRASTANELQRQLAEALRLTDRPALIEALIDPEEYQIQFEG